MQEHFEKKYSKEEMNHIKTSFDMKDLRESASMIVNETINHMYRRNKNIGKCALITCGYLGMVYFFHNYNILGGPISTLLIDTFFLVPYKLLMENPFKKTVYENKMIHKLKRKYKILQKEFLNSKESVTLDFSYENIKDSVASEDKIVNIEVYKSSKDQNPSRNERSRSIIELKKIRNSLLPEQLEKKFIKKLNLSDYR